MPGALHASLCAAPEFEQKLPCAHPHRAVYRYIYPCSSANLHANLPALSTARTFLPQHSSTQSGPAHDDERDASASQPESSSVDKREPPAPRRGELIRVSWVLTQLVTPSTRWPRAPTRNSSPYASSICTGTMHVHCNLAIVHLHCTAGGVHVQPRPQLPLAHLVLEVPPPH